MQIAVLLTIAVSQFLFLIALMILARDQVSWADSKAAKLFLWYTHFDAYSNNNCIFIMQLQDIISFGLSVTGFVPQCSPLVNCTVIMCIAFLPIFPITLFRNLTPLQFTTYFRYTIIAGTQVMVVWIWQLIGCTLYLVHGLICIQSAK